MSMAVYICNIESIKERHVGQLLTACSAASSVRDLVSKYKKE